MLLDKNGSPVRVGPLVQSDLITDEENEQSPYPDEHGLSVTPYDWDGDGDLDLVLGATSGAIFVCYNEGTKTAPEFAPVGEQLYAGLEELEVPSGSAMPVVADWDGDGKVDILSGSSSGPVYWFRNLGGVDEPMFAPAEKITDCKGTRTQVAVADYNGDGLPDLLVGDCVMQQNAPPDLSEEDQARFEELSAESEALQDEFQAALEKASEGGEVDFNELIDSDPELEELMEKMNEVRMDLQPMAPSFEWHGWVWLYERIPASGTP